MAVTFSVESSINVPEYLAKINNKQFWLFSINEWYRLIYKFIPFREGILADTVSISATDTDGTIDFQAPYANRMYNGDGFNFRKDLHPNASAHWDLAAEPTEKDKLIQAMQAYVDSGRLNSDE